MNRFDWREGDFEPAEDEEPIRPPQRVRVVVLFALLLILTSFTSIWWLQSDSRQVREQVEKVDVPTVVANNQVIESANTEILATEFRGNLATVEVLVDDPEVDAYSLRQTWFYRYADDAWKRIEPDKWLWGGKQEFRTENFHFIYHDLDQEAVELLAVDAEALYADLLVGLGKQGTGDDKKLIVEIMPEAFPSNVTQDDRIQLASPHMRPLHPSLTGRDALAWELAYNLSYRLLLETPFMSGVTSLNTRYMLQCMLPPSIAQRWAPMQPRNEYDRQQYLRSLVDWAGWSGADMSDMGRWSTVGWRKPQFECATYGDFIVDRFGYEKLGELVQAADQSYGWQQVIEKGLGIDYDEFQREWRSYVEASYLPAIEDQPADT